MITWETLSKHLEHFGLLENFDWTTCKGLDDIDKMHKQT